jgi:hypothetical protein
MSWASAGRVRGIAERKLRRLLPWSRRPRDPEIFPDDRFLVSYPRSGNTWARFLIANLVSPDEPATFANIEDRIPDIHRNRERSLEHVARPRLLKSHRAFDPRYRTVLYIVRDPRDVAVSYYHFQRKERHIRDRLPLDQYVTHFVSGEVSRFGSWGTHVASWLAEGPDRGAFLLLRYEDLLEHPEHELDRVATFLGVPRTHQQLAQAVDRSAIDRLRKLEETQGEEWVTTRGTRKDIPFIRTGARGTWRSALSEQSVRQIESAWGDVMKTLGYELTVAGTRDAGLHAGADADPEPGDPE